MTVSRRSFLQASLGSLVLPSFLLVGPFRPVSGATPVVRMPLDQFVQDQALVDALVEGVRVMKSRAPSDPTSWFFQAAIHGVSDDAIAQAVAEDSEVANVDQERFWNRCPHFGQNSADFTVWHRAYLYHFEGVLRAAANKPDLAVPYWNYTEAGQRRFPPLFAPEFLDEQETVSNPLHHPNREQVFAFGLFELTDPAVDNTDAMAAPEFFGVDEASGFAGGIADSESRTQGLIERRPHNLIHVAVGGSIGDVSGAMGQVTTAAFDPIFWPHHSNIDRLWVRWSCQPGKTWGALPPAEWFEERPWFFHDADGGVKNEPRRFYMEHAGLGYRYHDEDPACAPLPLPEFPIVVAAAEATPARVSRALVNPREDEITDQVVELEAAAGRTATTTLELPGLAQRVGDGSMRMLTTEAGDMPAQQRVILELAGLTVEGAPSAGFDVYVNAPEGEILDRSSPAFVGTVAIFGLNHAHGSPAPGENFQRFDITEALAAADPGADAINVAVVPFDLLQPVETNRAPLRRPDPLRVRRMRVVVVERPSTSQ
jgi:Common central domain of tyrosinase